VCCGIHGLHQSRETFRGSEMQYFATSMHLGACALTMMLLFIFILALCLLGNGTNRFHGG
jgi:hypothetical protein